MSADAIASQTRITWFDAELREIRTHALPTSTRDVQVIGPEHMVNVIALAGHARAELQFLGTPARAPVELGTWAYTGLLAYEPKTRVLAIPVVREEGGAAFVERFELDLAAHTAKRLAPLRTKELLARVVPLDPVTAHGLVAAGVTWEEGQMTLLRFSAHEDRGDAIEVTRTRTKPELSLLGVDASGTAYFTSRTGRELVRVPARGAPETRELDVGEVLGEGGFRELVGSSGAVSPDGQTILVPEDGGIVALEHDGAVRWRLPGSVALHAVFRADGALVLATATGLILADAQTGQIRKRACGYAFSLSEVPPPSELFHEEHACSVDE